VLACNDLAALSPCFLEQIGIAVLQGNGGAGSTRSCLLARHQPTGSRPCWMEEFGREGRRRARPAHLPSTSNSTKVDFNRWHLRALWTSRSPNKWLRLWMPWGVADQLAGW